MGVMFSGEPANDGTVASQDDTNKVFDDGVGKKIVHPFFTAEPTEEVLRMIEVPNLTILIFLLTLT